MTFMSHPYLYYNRFMLCLYNSKTLRKEKFISLSDKKVKMYVCGITPYDTTHLGHAFTYVSFDVLIRYFQYRKYDLTYVQNVTDIDDDILRKAKEENTNWKELGDFWTKKFLSDMKSLNVLPPTRYIKATDSITPVIRIIKVLIEKGFAYENDGNVYFEVNKFKKYGRLSTFNRNQMILISKERGGNPDDPLKKDSLDFLLWQRSKRKPFWESPWGQGRPGWHIECSAMINQYLGDQIDIHGGGRDLVFPHHESEIAQSESFTEKRPFVKFWLHTAMVLYQGEKMAKSLGNLVMVSDLLKQNTANEIRWLLLSHHYRKTWEFEKEELKKIKEDFFLVLKALNKAKTSSKVNNFYMKKFLTFMDEDLDTPKALIFLVDLAKIIIKDSKNNEANLESTLLKCLLVLGFKL